MRFHIVHVPAFVPAVLLLALSLATSGCSGSSAHPPGDAGATPSPESGAASAAEAAVNWSVTVGANDPSVCPVGGGDDWSVGNPEGTPFVATPSGTSYSGVPVTVNCDVAQSAVGTYSVTASVQYGDEGSLSIRGTIVTTTGLPGSWPVQTNITGAFDDHLGLTENLTETDCTISFAANPNMGIAPSRVWGTLTCPHATAPDGKTCQGVAEFLLENCGT